MKKVLFEPNCEGGTIWVDWMQEIVSFHEAAGFEPIPFTTQECWHESLRILMAADFRFQ